MESPTEKIRPYSHLQAYKKGTTIFFQGESPRKGAMVASGVVRSYAIASSGEEKTIAFFTKDDILPLSWLMGTTRASLFHYEAVSDVHLLQFSRDDFKTYILDDQKALLALFNTLTKDHTAAMLRINGLEQSRAEDKIAFTLYYLVFRYGTKEPEDSLHTIGITLRHATIAGLVGLSRESTTKILGHLQRDGIVFYSQGKYRVNKTLLEQYIGEDVFRDIVL